jgi:hypothetical protein
MTPLFHGLLPTTKTISTTARCRALRLPSTEIDICLCNQPNRHFDDIPKIRRPPIGNSFTKRLNPVYLSRSSKVRKFILASRWRGKLAMEQR